MFLSPKIGKESKGEEEKHFLKLHNKENKSFGGSASLAELMKNRRGMQLTRGILS